MTIVTDILKQMPAVSQPQRKFLAMLFATILALRGHVTFRNLSRYCDYSERTISRQFRVLSGMKGESKPTLSRAQSKLRS
jgi:hypothetical protein